jgi:hypothetical protein
MKDAQREGIRLLVWQPFSSVLLSLAKGCVADVLASWFGVYAWQGIVAAWRCCCLLSFFLPLRLKVLVGLYRQGTEQGDAPPPPLLCIHEKYASAVACSR